MANFEPLAMNHQKLFEPLWKSFREKYRLFFSEYSFSNNYLFRKWHDFEVVLEPTPLLKGKFKDKTAYLIPTIAAEELAKQAEKWMASMQCALYPIPEEWLAWFPTDRFTHSFQSSDADYLYKKEKLKTLSGRKLSARRNLIHQLENHYKVQSAWITPSEIPDALQVLKQWYQKTAREIDDCDICREALTNLAPLGLFGLLAYGNDEPLGFTVGERLNSKVGVIHVAKARRDVKGATPFLYREFASHLPDSVEWVNLEQDLGDLNLRQAKRAYAPDRLVKKWIVRLR